MRGPVLHLLKHLHIRSSSFLLATGSSGPCLRSAEPAGVEAAVGLVGAAVGLAAYAQVT